MACFIFECPHCNLQILVYSSEINCQIFRHGVYKNTFQDISPHTPKLECDRLIKEDLIIGCGKPFRFNGITAEICDYI